MARIFPLFALVAFLCALTSADSADSTNYLPPTYLTNAVNLELASHRTFLALLNNGLDRFSASDFSGVGASANGTFELLKLMRQHISDHVAQLQAIVQTTIGIQQNCGNSGGSNSNNNNGNNNNLPVVPTLPVTPVPDCQYNFGSPDAATWLGLVTSFANNLTAMETGLFRGTFFAWNIVSGGGFNTQNCGGNSGDGSGLWCFGPGGTSLIDINGGGGEIDREAEQMMAVLRNDDDNQQNQQVFQQCTLTANIMYLLSAMLAVDARQASWLNTISGRVPFPNAFEPAVGPEQSFQIFNQWITSCPYNLAGLAQAVQFNDDGVLFAVQAPDGQIISPNNAGSGGSNGAATIGGGLLAMILVALLQMFM